MFSFPAVEYEQSPFPHCVVEGAWSPEVLAACKRECDSLPYVVKDDPPRSFHKGSCSDWNVLGESLTKVINFCSSPQFIEWLEKVTGERYLVPDPYLRGGGVHRISRGGYLGMHVDFNWHEQMKLYRRLNLLLYLNEGWKDDWGGHLYLGREGYETWRRIFPLQNTMAVFTTSNESWHGHPEGVCCPDNVYRDSIALYYYSPVKPEGEIRNSTKYDV